MGCLGVFRVVPPVRASLAAVNDHTRHLHRHELLRRDREGGLECFTDVLMNRFVSARPWGRSITGFSLTVDTRAAFATIWSASFACVALIAFAILTKCKVRAANQGKGKGASGTNDGKKLTEGLHAVGCAFGRNICMYSS